MEEITVTVVGCGDAFTSGGQLHTCFYIKAPHTKLLLDCGATAYYGIKRQGLNVDDIDTIVISHFHGDHYGGVPFLLLEAAVQNREKPLTIISPPTGKERIARLLDQLYPGNRVFDKLNLMFKNYRVDGVLQADHLEIAAFPVEHTPDTLPHGLRLGINGKIISFSGDTGWTSMLIELARDADLFICECNYYHSDIKGHMNYKTLLSYGEQLLYKRMLLTHLGREMIQYRDQINHPCAYDGMTLVL